MEIILKNKQVLNISSPKEQKIIRSDDTARWVASFSILDQKTSTELDQILTSDNISEIYRMIDNEPHLIMSGYNTITMLTIRYASDGKTVADVQMTKDVPVMLDTIAGE